MPIYVLTLCIFYPTDLKDKNLIGIPVLQDILKTTLVSLVMVWVMKEQLDQSF